MPTVKLPQLQPKTVKVTREFAILAARMIPLPGKGDPISLDLLANVEYNWEWDSHTHVSYYVCYCHITCVQALPPTDSMIGTISQGFHLLTL